MTTRDDSEVLYMIAGKYIPSAAMGVRFDDPAFTIRWPMQPVVISARDRNYPLLST
jgi:dTDP-4-dehydrorhamnose 3,5-epimerase